jgi:beta-barrel assembly-enhancing protease
MNISCLKAYSATLCLVVCLTLSTTAAAFAAGTGEAESARLDAYHANLLTLDEERIVGQRLAYLYEQRHTLLQDAEIKARLNRIRARLRSVIPLQELEIKIVRSAQPEAVSFPPGYIYVTSSLVKLASTDDELAAVIAHEAAHIKNHHLSRLIAFALSLPARAQESFPTRRAIVTGRALRFAFPSILDDARQRSEIEADKMAIRWVEGAGYTSHALALLLESLKACTPAQARHERSGLQARITLLREESFLAVRQKPALSLLNPDCLA